jgi:hypothetical protein
VCPQTYDPTSLGEKKINRERKREIEWKFIDWRGEE